MRRRSFLARVWARLLRFERAHALLRPGAGVVAAVSGGPDSVCLLHYLSRRAKALGFPLAAVHVHHGLRGAAADRDARFAVVLANQLGVANGVHMVDTKTLARKEKRSLEDAARVLRYQALEHSAKGLRYPRIATAHTLSDHAETVLLHLLRGTDPKGLLGIPIQRENIVRPLLCLTREEVLEYLRFFKLDYRTDETNRDEDFTRNWVRRRVIPLLKKKSPKLEEHLGLMSEKLRQQLRRSPPLPSPYK